MGMLAVSPEALVAKAPSAVATTRRTRGDKCLQTKRLTSGEIAEKIVWRGSRRADV
jgi:hypothetical protein